MKAERWQQIDYLYHSVLERVPAQRPAFLAAACAGDEELHREVESLLASHEQANEFIEEPVVAAAARVLANQQSSALVGHQIDHYKILALLGAGGMGEVYLAQDFKLGRKVALKLLDLGFSGDTETRTRFLREARLASSLDHPNICTIHEVGEAAGRPFIAMQCVEGQSLRQVIGGQPLGLDSLLSISLQVADALAAAHAQSIIHRDIKPGNIIVTPHGQVKVLDFGLAKLLESEDGEAENHLTMTGVVMGTPASMSPEQARGERADHRSDIFSFGGVVYEMATGCTPFKGKSRADVISALLKEPHTPAVQLNKEIPARLSAVIDRALVKEPAGRYQSMREMISDLREVVAEAGGLDHLFSLADLPRGVVPLVPLQRRTFFTAFGQIPRPAAIAFVASMALALVVLALVIYHSWAQQPLPAMPIKSIAVLPLKPLVADSRDESLEMGMADTLITRLSNLRQIIVRPMSAVRRYSGLEQDPVAAGREQGVDAVLDGSIQKSGERVRVTVRLISTADGQQLWADKFEDKFTDIFSVQDSISERVAAALAVKLSGEEKKQLTKRYTENAEAYQLYLKGRYFASKWTPEGFKKGIEYLNLAIAIDPNYALAYDGLAYCYYNSFYIPFKEAMTKGREFAKRALEIEPTLAEAHVSLGLINTWLDYDWPAAEREFKKAIDLKPNYASAHLWYGVYLSYLERSAESIAEIKRAIELDPLSAEANTGLGVVLFYARRYDEANEQIRKTLDLEPNFWFARLHLARVHQKRGELPAAVAELEKTKLIEGASTEVLSALGYAYAMSGKNDQAQKIIIELKNQSKQSYVPPYNIATIYAGLGEKDQAFAYLEKEYSEGAYYMNLLKVDPELDSLRSDPRYSDLLRRMNFAR